MFRGLRLIESGLYFSMFHDQRKNSFAVENLLDNYNFTHTMFDNFSRQPSNESLLPSVTEGVSSPGGGSPEEQSPYRQIPSIISTPSQESTVTAGPEPEPEPVQPDPTPAPGAATHPTVNDDVITA